ncbi:MAG: cytochrome P450 [Thermoleophilia bacterium]|nr:cytochrome P450 [Thermoleophilia bacterium]
MSAAHPGNPGARLAKRHEARLFRASQRLFWMFNMYARHRRREVVKVPFLGYAVNGAVAVREVLLDDEHFPNTNSMPDTVLITQVVGPQSLTNQNGPPHKALRSQLQDLFTPKYVRALCDDVLTDVMDDFRERLLAGEMCDVARLARVITGSIVSSMNGETFGSLAEKEQRALDLTRIGGDIASMVPARLKAVGDERLARAEALIEQLIAGVKETYDAGDERTVPGRFKARGIPWDVARGIIVVLILGGTETTQSGSARLVAMLCDTDQWPRLRADHDLLDNTLDEALRVCTPVPIITRWVKDDYVFRGVPMKKDKLVITFTNNAVRDRSVIDRGGDFDIGRAIPRELRQLPFGAGPHFCLGFNLARREITMMMEQLLALPRPVEVVDREYATKVLMPAYRRLEIRMVRD